MKKPKIICIDDQREVLAAIKKDLDMFTPAFNVVDCESAAEADEILNDFADEKEEVAVIICDHIMPGENGIDFLTRLNKDQRFLYTKKFILTGLANHSDTIQAINEAEINAYLEKPWDKEEFVSIVKKLLTRFVVESGMDSDELVAYLDQATLDREIKRKKHQW
ncbi:MAG: response regulator [Calditrichaceae bacterium]|nr:response regulator [Calditrichaceae bacterium]HES59911.1 response regulator [Caldithrix sp.]